MPNIKDVAQKAGVTVTTVSRVLNNRGYISEKTRKKVCEAMEEINYQPNELARALFRQKSSFIGLIVPSVSNPFFAELTEKIEYYAHKFGYKIILCNSFKDSKKEQECIEMLKRHQVEGIIMGSHAMEVSEYLSIKLPIVSIDRILLESTPYVASDNYAGGVLATKLLINKGCRKLAHISGNLILNTSANKRCEAFIDTAKEYGVPYIVKETSFENFDEASYQDEINSLFHKYPNIDGIFASSDLIAATIIKVAANLGKKIPRDLKIVGYDDVNIASLIVPNITTIRQSIEEMGSMLVELIIKLVENQEVNIKNILPIDLIERDST